MSSGFHTYFTKKSGGGGFVQVINTWFFKPYYHYYLYLLLLFTFTIRVESEKEKILLVEVV